MLRWFFDTQDSSPLEILSVVSPEALFRAGAVSLPDTALQTNRRSQPDASDDDEISEAVLRWRRVVLNLSEEFSRAANRHPHLAPVFMEAMGNLLEQLLLFSREEDVIALDEWLSFCPPPQIAFKYDERTL